MEDAAVQGLAFICDREGALQHWLRDDFGLAQVHHGDVPFIRFLDESSQSKGLQFLSQLKKGGAAVDWELCFSLAGKARALSVGGLENGIETMVLAAHSASALRTLCRELAVSRPECSAGCLEILGVCDESSTVAEEADIYADFMRMYNDFARLQREFASQNAKLRRLDAEKDRIMDMAAHDLRNPLHVITLLASGLSRQAEERLRPNELSALHKVIETARDMGRLINNILDVSRFNPGPPGLHLQPGNLHELVCGRIELIRPMANAKRIDIAFSSETDVPMVSFDAARLQQVMDNLLSNALKFSPTDTQVQVRLVYSDDGVVVEVADQGPGVPEGELTQIFQPFTKGSARPTDGEASSGLGLAICRSIMEAHRGKIWAENSSHGGAAIKFSLPTRQEKAGAHGG